MHRFRLTTPGVGGACLALTFAAMASGPSDRQARNTTLRSVDAEQSITAFTATRPGTRLDYLVRPAIPLSRYVKPMPVDRGNLIYGVLNLQVDFLFSADPYGRPQDGTVVSQGVGEAAGKELMLTLLDNQGKRCHV